MNPPLKSILKEFVILKVKELWLPVTVLSVIGAGMWLLFLADTTTQESAIKISKYIGITLLLLTTIALFINVVVILFDLIRSFIRFIKSNWKQAKRNAWRKMGNNK